MVGAILMGLAIIAYAALNDIVARAIGYVFGAIAISIIVPTTSILGLRSARNIYKNIKKMRRRKRVKSGGLIIVLPNCALKPKEMFKWFCSKM